MCSARTAVLVVALAGALPEGGDEVARRHADVRGLTLRWREVDDVAAARAALADHLGPSGAVVLASGDAADSRELAAAVTAVPVPVVHVDAAELTTHGVVQAACDRVLHGRGRRGLRAALDLIVAGEHPPHRHPYGPHPDQVLEVRWPTSPTGGVGTAVLFHGGFWLDPWERDQLDRLAIALTLRGWLTANVGYRRMGPSGGGWPATLTDACNALDAVADLPLRGDGPVVVVGHSAGATLGLYAATRHAFVPGDQDPDQDPDRDPAAAAAAPAAIPVAAPAAAPAAAPGEPPRVRAAGVVSLAGLLDLDAAARDDLADGATASFLGGMPDDVPDRYRVASPLCHLPLGLPLLALHGPDDPLVPVSQTRAFVTAARAAGDTVEHAEPTTSHLDIIDPDGPAWPALTAWLDGLLAD